MCVGASMGLSTLPNIDISETCGSIATKFYPDHYFGEVVVHVKTIILPIIRIQRADARVG